MIAFHAGYLWGRPGQTAFRLIGVFLVGSLLVTAGVFESPGTLDWIRFRMPGGYVAEGFRLVRFTAGLFAALHAGMNHLPAGLRYRAYVAGDGIGKVRFFVWRLIAEGIVLSLAYVAFCFAFVAIGFAGSVRFHLDAAVFERIGWGLLSTLQAAVYASFLTLATKSILGVLPILAALAMSAESRSLDQVRDDVSLSWTHRLMTTETILADGTVRVFEPLSGLIAFATVTLLLILLYGISDGETA